MFFLNISDLEARGVIIISSREKNHATTEMAQKSIGKYIKAVWPARKPCPNRGLCAAHKFYLFSSGKAPKA